MDRPTCCKKPSWILELDLDHAGGFEYALGKCGRCGAYALNVFCVATSITGFEPVSVSDVERMKTIPSGPERKAFMREWGEKNL
jgi:hypothetical protein